MMSLYNKLINSKISVFLRDNDKIENIEKIFCFLIPFFIILGTNSVYSILSDVDLHITTILAVLLLVWFMLSFITCKIDIEKMKKNKKYIIFYFVFIFIFFILNNIVSVGNFIISFGVILPLLIISISCHKDTIGIIKTLLKNYCYSIICISAISLFFHFIGSITDIIRPFNTVEARWSINRLYYNYYYLHFETQYFKLFGNQFARNTAIFPESPIYVLHLITALTIYMYILNKNNKKHIGLLMVTVVTTFSTIGMGLVAIIILEKIISFVLAKSKGKIKLSKKHKIILGVIITLILAIVIFFVVQRLQTTSFIMRMDDYIASIKAWTDSPIIGNGYDNKSAIEKYMVDDRVDNGLSNSITTLLSDGGIYFYMLYIIPTFMVAKYFWKNKKYSYLKAIAILAIMFCCIIFKYTPLMLLFLAVAISYIMNINKNEVEKC